MIGVAMMALALQGAPPPPDERIPAIREILESGMVDYPSARFRDVRIVARPSRPNITLAVCGQFNSRNRTGGYSGWTNFVILNDRIEAESTSATSARLYQVWCKGADVDTLISDITDDIAASTAPDPT